ncbi:MAG: hypothetical protein IPK26_29800 [Planctomycetes bacterium]|nr:hypothetical protein [Planctomycetota bacterium]
MHHARRLLVSFAFALPLLLSALPAQVAPTELSNLTQLSSSTPLPGSTNVPLNRPVSITATAALRAHTINEDSVQITVAGVPLLASYSVSVDARTILIGFPTLLPANSRVDVTMDCAAIRDRAGRMVDFDLDGREGGIARGHFFTGDGGNTPPMRQGTAAVFGRVFDTNGAPLQGAVMRGWFYPRLEGQPPLAVPFGISNATGDIRWDTPQFAGEQSFLVEVGKPGFSEVLRRVTVLVDGCVRIDDAVLQQLAPRTVVDRLAGGTIADPSGRVRGIVIPPGALQATSNIGITVLQNSNAIRERLPNNIVGGTAGLYVDVAGVFGEQTTQPVTMRVPNTYNLPLGTLIPFGKVDHNTLEWVDFRNLYGGPPPGSGQPHPALGRVVPDSVSGTVIEVQFDHFCTPVCSYCLPIRPPEEPETPDGDGGPCDGGNVAGSSIVDSREGFLREVVALPGFTEFGERWDLRLGYASSAAAPSVTMRAQSRYASPNGRPVERTLFRYTIEGRAFEAAYDRSLQNNRPLSHCFWDGRNVLGQMMPTGSYPFTMEITTLNADVPVAIPSTFGGTSIQSFGATYPGQIRTQSTVKRDRIVVVNLRDSAYGAGWSVMNEDRLHIDPDGCLVLTYGNGWYRRYTPDANTPGTWISRSGDFSTITYDAPSQTYRRSFTDGEVHTFLRSGLLQRRVNRFGYATTFTYNAGNRLTQITSPTGFYYRFFYDGSNKLDRIEDSAARVTQITVNGSGDLTEVFDVLNTRRTFSYDADHRMLTNVGYRGERAEYTYQNGRIVRTRQFDVGGGTLLRERLFSPSSLSGEVVDALARGIGSLGQPLPIVETEVDVYTDGTGGTRLFHRDGEGQLFREDDPIGRRIDYTYFANGLLQSTSRPDGSSTHYTYDSAGMPLTAVERNTGGGTYSTVSNEYNGVFRQISRVVDGEGKQTLFTYDSFGSVVSVTDHDSHVTTFAYADGRFPSMLTRMTSAAGLVESATYDSHGNMVTRTDFPDPINQPQGRTWTLARDARGNVSRPSPCPGARAR